MPSQVTLFARQPIHDRELEISGYELLFRAAQMDTAQFADGASATADVVTRAMLDVGFDTLVGASKAWINVDRDFLVGRAFEAMPPERVVLEVLETVRSEPEVLEALRAARRQGFQIALDDFELNPDTRDLIAQSDVIKLDCYSRSPEQAHERVVALRAEGPRLLAEKVETPEMFAACLDAGAELFQGYFFTRPQPVMGSEIKTDRARLMCVVAELNDPSVSIARVTELVQSDVGLAYRLLRYANSAAIGRIAHFEKVRDAITMLGLDRVRACATLMLLGSLSNKPPELARVALVRARYCQLIGTARAADAQKHFAAGLFSVLDAYLDASMDQVVTKLPLDEELTAALVGRQGSIGEVLGATIACEHADWRKAHVEGISEEQLGASYLAAVTWADSMQTALDPV